jgi:hypothetical protein
VSKQILEDIVVDTFADILNLRTHPETGNLRGDGDVGPKSFSVSALIQLGFECKDKAGKSHSVPGTEWKKAKTQLSRRGLDPVFVTRNSESEILVHMDISLLKLLVEIIQDSVHSTIPTNR